MENILFTPVEVVRKHTQNYTLQELLRFNQLFELTQPKVLSLDDERRKVISWLKRLSLQQRQLSAALHSPQLAALLRKLYQQGLTNQQPFRYCFRIEDGEFTVQRERLNRQSRDIQKAFLKQVTLLSQGQLFEAVTLSETSFTDPEGLIQRIDEVLGGILIDTHSFRQEELQSGRVRFEAEVEQGQFKTIGVWIAQLLLKQIFLSFVTQGSKIECVSKHMKEQQQEYSKLWRQLQPQQRMQLVGKAFKKPVEELMGDYRSSVGVVLQELPKIYCSKSEQQMIREYAQYSPKDIFAYLTFSTAEESLQLASIYKVEVALEIQALLSACKTQMKKHKKKKKKNGGHIDIRNSITAKELPIASNIVTQVKEQKNPVNAVSVNAKEPRRQIPYQQQPLKQTSEISQQTVITQQEKDCLISQQQVPVLDAFLKKIRQKNRDKIRKIVLNRLTVILAQLNLTCKTYGSYAVALSLPNSDLDVQVDSSLLTYFYMHYLSQREQLIAALDFLKNTFSSFSWVYDISLFHNAKIPILSFKADASVHFANTTKSKLKLNGKSLLKEQSFVQVDLSVEPYANMGDMPHNGLQATQSIKQWMQTWPAFQGLALGIKYIIRQANLHKSYQGGINSYCLLLILYAFLRSQNPQAASTDKLFDLFIKFIVRFYQQHLTIDINSEKIIKQGGSSTILLSPWDKRNLLQRCFRLPQIIQAVINWRATLSRL